MRNPDVTSIEKVVLNSTRNARVRAVTVRHDSDFDSVNPI